MGIPFFSLYIGLFKPYASHAWFGLPEQQLPYLIHLLVGPLKQPMSILFKGMPDDIILQPGGVYKVFQMEV